MRAFLSLAVVTTGLLLPRPMAAQEDAPVTFTGNVAVKSDYTFRGISQTQEEVAIQGGMNGTGPAGLYLGVWGSSFFLATFLSPPVVMLVQKFTGSFLHTVAVFGVLCLVLAVLTFAASRRPGAAKAAQPAH